MIGVSTPDNHDVDHGLFHSLLTCTRFFKAMTSSLDFVNPGIHFAGVKSQLTEIPPAVVICGLPRSGTTAIAAGFRKAGFDLGNGLSNVIEDQAFRNAVLTKDVAQVRQYFDRRRKEPSELPVCVKFPDAYKSIPLIHKSLPGTVFIVATRDPFCVALRNNISMFADFSTFYRKSTYEYSKMFEAVSIASGLSPILIVAYEKLLSSPVSTFDSVFSSVLPGIANITALAELASEAIELNPKDYLDESNIKPCFEIKYSESNISGYCFFKANPERSVILEIYSNSQVLLEIVCDQPCEGLTSAHPTGLCGFQLPLSTIGLANTSNFKIRIKGTSHQLY